jgi:hypothetical protein
MLFNVAITIIRKSFEAHVQIRYIFASMYGRQYRLRQRTKGGDMIGREHNIHKNMIGFILVPLMICFVSFGAPPQDAAKEPKSTSSPAIKKLGDSLVQVGNIIVDTQKKMLTVKGKALPSTSGPDPEPGVSAPPKTLEYLATARDGMKAYESALELDTDAITFNFALIMIGIEKGKAVPSKDHFDPAPAKGDAVEIWVEWGDRKVRAEELLYDQQTKTVPRIGDWVYTGSIVLPDGRYLAEMDGTLIGFIHDPDDIIESSLGVGIGTYGSICLNPSLKLTTNTAVKVTIRALPKETKK